MMADAQKHKARSTLPADEWVGSRIRLRRNTVRMSQTELGTAIGVTFRQIQKYERGTNRVGAGRLQQISRVLGIPVAWFFEGAPKPPKTGAEPTERMSAFAAFMRSRYAAEIVSSFVKLSDPLQKSVTLLISQVAAGAGVEQVVREVASDLERERCSGRCGVNSPKENPGSAPGFSCLAAGFAEGSSWIAA